MRFFALIFLSMALASSEALKPEDTLSHCVGFDPGSGHSFKAHCNETIQRAGRTSEMSYNALGLRDKDYAPKPKPGWQRVLFVGSSRMAAPGLDAAHTPPRILEKILREGGQKIEVINAGVEGYSLLHQASKMEEWLKAYSPTLLVVHVEFQPTVSSDLMYAPYLVESENSFRLEMRILRWMKPLTSLLGMNPENYSDFRKAITWQSAGYRAYRSLRCRLGSTRSVNLTNCMAEQSIHAMFRIKKIGEAAGAKVLFLIPSEQFTNELHLSPAFDSAAFEFWDKLTPKLQMTSSAVVMLFREKKIPLQVLTPLSAPSLTLPGDYHFNEVGAELFARSAASRMLPLLLQ